MIKDGQVIEQKQIKDGTLLKIFIPNKFKINTETYANVRLTKT